MARTVHTAIPTGVERIAEGPEKGAGYDDSSGAKGGYLDDEGVRLNYVRTALSTGMTYQEQTLKPKLTKHRALWAGEHPPNSKYRSAAFSKRSRLFRPKIPQMGRRHVAMACDALFGSVQVATIEAQDQSNPAEVAGAKLRGELLNWHLRPEGDSGWFEVALGGYDMAQRDGIVCGKMEWSYERNEDGDVVSDRLDPDLIWPEHLLFDPGASWKDPVGSSPWIIEIMPMRVDEIEARMESDMGDDDTADIKAWKRYERATIRSAQSLPTIMETRQTSEEKKQDAGELSEHDLVYVLRVIKREGGKDYFHYVLGETWELTEPEPLSKLFLGGERPYVVGHCTIEGLETYRAGPLRYVEHLQYGINDLCNLRLDKIRLSVAGRYLTRRGSQLPYDIFERAVPGHTIEVDNPNTDVRELQTSSVDSAAFEEGDRMSAEFDDTAGVMNSGTVQAQRNLNETVGGMELMGQGADLLAKLQLTTYVISFIYKMLAKGARLIGAYETDNERVMNAARQVGVAGSPEEGQDPQMAAMAMKAYLKEPFKMQISVGTNAVNPMTRIQKLVFALSSVLQISPTSMKRLKADEVEAEVMGCAGYSDAGRFFTRSEEAPPDDPYSNPEVLGLALDYSKHREKLGLQAQVEAVRARLTSKKLEESLLRLASDTETSKEQMQVDIQKFVAQLKQDREKMVFETQVEQPNPRLM